MHARSKRAPSQELLLLLQLSSYVLSSIRPSSNRDARTPRQHTPNSIVRLSNVCPLNFFFILQAPSHFFSASSTLFSSSKNFSLSIFILFYFLQRRNFPLHPVQRREDTKLIFGYRKIQNPPESIAWREEFIRRTRGWMIGRADARGRSNAREETRDCIPWRSFESNSSSLSLTLLTSHSIHED